MFQFGAKMKKVVVFLGFFLFIFLVFSCASSQPSHSKQRNLIKPLLDSERGAVFYVSIVDYY